jgi:hypothetical protein
MSQNIFVSSISKSFGHSTRAYKLFNLLSKSCRRFAEFLTNLRMLLSVDRISGSGIKSDSLPLKGLRPLL